MKLYSLLLFIAVYQQSHFAVDAQQQSNETCDVLDKLIDSGVNVIGCTKNQFCTGISCTRAGIVDDFTIAFSPCSRPLTLSYSGTIRRNFGFSTFSGTTTSSTSVRGLNLQITPIPNGTNFRASAGGEVIFQAIDIPLRCAGLKIQFATSILVLLVILSSMALS